MTRASSEKPLGRYSLHCGRLEADISNLGGRVLRLCVDGVDVVQGFDTVEDYLPERHASDFGAVIGRYANRLAGGRITVEGRTYHLPTNNGPNTLHGGPRGWQYALFDVEACSDTRLVLSLVSPDGDNGFPGTVRARVTYTLTPDALRIDYHATADSPSVINLTNHSYFNLSGDLSASAMGHTLWIDADRYTPTDETAIPLAGHLGVEGTPMDFRQEKAVGRDIEADYGQLRVGHGYDHNFVLNTRGDLSRPCARLGCGRLAMEVCTTAPGLQLYTGNFLDGVRGKQGKPYPRRSAICLETQQYPDSPNRAWAESTGRISPERPFDSATIFRFK